MSIQSSIAYILSDKFLFPALQIGLMLFAVYIAVSYRGRFRRLKDGNPVVNMRVTRSEGSMKIFYGTYAAINGVLIVICLSVEAVKQYRVFWVLFDTSLVLYICLINRWFRNKLIEWSIKLTRIESG